MRSVRSANGRGYDQSEPQYGQGCCLSRVFLGQAWDADISSPEMSASSCKLQLKRQFRGGELYAKEGLMMRF